MASLFEDYLAENPALAPFYEAFPRAIDAIPPSPRPWNPDLAAALRGLQEALGVAPNFLGNEPVIVTGQQPGLFTGPLYTIYKAITAIQLAQRLGERHGVRYVPVFWVAGDDHDFEESRTAHVLSRRHESIPLRYAPEADDVDVRDFPMYRVPLTDQAHRLIDELAAQAPGSENAAEIAEFLHATAVCSDSLAEWTARLLAGLFRDTSLTFFLPNLHAAREAAIPVLEREISEPLASTRLLTEAGERLRAMGYAPQIEKRESECGFFVEFGGRRRKVRFEHGHYVIPDEALTCPVDEMLELLHAAPERFSPNVALRCLVQQTLFPASAYVAGPGETAYWAQLKPLFAHFDLPMPIVYPRVRAVLTTAKLDKIRGKLGFSFNDLQAPEETLIEHALRNTGTNPALDVIANKGAAIQSEFSGLVEALLRLKPKDTSYLDMAKSASEQSAALLERLERAVLRSDAAQTEAVRKQVQRLQTALAPDRGFQERHYCAFSFVFEQGWDFVPRLLKLLDSTRFETQEVEL
jgi:bacillithiol biosynthesis cysteine-adding enzyme BshC